MNNMQQQQQLYRGSMSGSFDVFQQPTNNSWSDGGLQIIAPELAGITSTTSSFVANNYDRAPNTMERSRFASSTPSFAASSRSPRPELTSFSSGSIDSYMPSAYSRDELYPFSPKTATASWPPVAPSTPAGGFSSAKSPNPKHQQQRNTVPPDGFIYQVSFIFPQ